MGFKNFMAEEKVVSINEASFSAKNLEKVVKLISKLASRKMGSKLYPLNSAETFKRSGGAGGSGIGFRVVDKTGKMLRFNWEKGTKSQFVISSVDFWDTTASLDKPTRTVKLGKDLNIIKVVDNVMDALLTGKVNEAVDSVDADMDLEAGITEARSKRSQEEKEAWLEGKGLPKSMKYSEKEMRDRAAKEGLSEELEIFLGSSETNSFEDGIVAAEKAFEAKVYADPETVFDDLEDLTRVVAMGKQNSLIVAGMGGVGKTFHVEKIMKEVHGAPGKDWVHFKGLKSSPFGLFFNMFLNRDKVIVFDDSDSVMGDKDMVNMFKSALDTYENRPISWQSKTTVNVSNMTPEEIGEYMIKLDNASPEELGSKGYELPSTFNFTGKVVFISNLPASKFDDAIKSRSLFINIYLHQTDVLRRINSIAASMGDQQDEVDEIMEALGGHTVNKHEDIITYMSAEKAREGKELTMRAYQVAKALKDAGLPNWANLSSLYA